MPSIQSLVVTDRQATPVNRTLLPQGERDGIVTLALADASGALNTERRLTIGQKRSSDRIRTTLKYKVPTTVVETVNGVPNTVVIREALVTTEFIFSTSSTEAERNNIVGEHQSMFSNTKVMIHDMVVKGEAAW